MNDFMDDNLRKALRQEQAPEGFAGRVMARLPERRSSQRPYWYTAVAAVLAFVLLFTGLQKRREEQAQHAQQTERQVVFALALAMDKFEHVSARLQKSAPKVTVQEKQGERL